MYKFRKSTIAIVLALFVVPLLAGCASRSTKVTLTSYKIAFDNDRTTFPSGDNTFVITNTADIEHEFVIFKTDLAADQLPLTADGNAVDEEGQGVQHIDEVEVQPGNTETLKVNLPAGNYVVICNMTDPSSHYMAGMHQAITVK